MPGMQEAFELAARGWRVHPLFALTEQGVCTCPKKAACTSPGKHPHIKAWDKAATIDEEVIAGWWERWPKSNVAVVMGPSSGIIDLEADNDEAEQFLIELFKGYEIITPTFKSSRGTHRLFKYTSDLPNSEKAHWRLKPDLELDFKIGNGKGTYCVFPPSRHASGAVYQWVFHPDDCDVAEIPPEVIARLHVLATEGDLKVTEGKRRPQEHWNKIASGVSEGGRNESAASFAGKMIASIANPEDRSQQELTWQNILNWNYRNTPPLDEGELRTTFDSILNRHIASMQQGHFTQRKSIPDEKNPAEGWHLVRVDADPPYYKLYSPLWDDFVRLNDNELLSSHHIRLEAQKQKCYGLEPSFKKFWDGTKQTVSAYRYLMDRVAREKATFDERLENVLSHRVYERLQAAMEAESPQANGRPVRIDDVIWFQLSYLRDFDKFLADNEREVVKILKSVCDSRERVKRMSGGQYRFKTLSSAGMQKLKQLAFYGAEIDEDELVSVDSREFPETE